jgi:hypothetical protein
MARRQAAGPADGDRHAAAFVVLMASASIISHALFCAENFGPSISHPAILWNSRTVPPGAPLSVVRAAGLARKGVIRAGNDADLLMVGMTFQSTPRFARGRVSLKHGRPVIGGMFDRTIMDQFA